MFSVYLVLRCKTFISVSYYDFTKKKYVLRNDVMAFFFLNSVRAVLFPQAISGLKILKTCLPG